MENQRAFWEWFEGNESRFRSIQLPRDEPLLDEIQEALHAYSPGVWFETGQAEDGCNELIVSAEGQTRYFSAVRTLIASAPLVPGWRFIAFKPAQGFDFDTRYEGIVLSPKATWYMPLRSAADPTALGLRIGYAHYDPAREREFLAGTFIMLECALGELALAEQVKHIEVAALPSSPESSGYLPLPALAHLVGASSS